MLQAADYIRTSPLGSRAFSGPQLLGVYSSLHAFIDILLRLHVAIKLKKGRRLAVGQACCRESLGSCAL